MIVGVAPGKPGVAVRVIVLDGTVLIGSASFFVGGVFEHPESKLT